MRVEDISKVCVIGGGPAGLAAAIAVSQMGYRATVVDHAVPPIEKACGEGLMPDSVHALSRLGVKVPFEAGFRFRGIRFSDARSTVAADFPDGPGKGVRRALLHELLLQRARELGVDCLWGVRRVEVTGTQVAMDKSTAFQKRALASLAMHPKLFESLLAVHVHARSFSDLFSWQLLHFCRTFLEA